MLDRVPLAGHTVIADKNFAGQEFEALMAAHGAQFLRPDRRNEPLGAITISSPHLITGIPHLVRA
jgi:hypothetical protein